MNEQSEVDAKRVRASRGRAVAWFAAGAASALVVGGGVALAAIPNSSTGVITACVKKKGGDVRIIDAQKGAKCTSKEKRVTWSQKGPKGATGARGTTGARGLIGPGRRARPRRPDGCPGPDGGPGSQRRAGSDRRTRSDR